MSLNNLNPLIMPKTFGQNAMNNSSNVSPQEWEYIQTMRRTGWDVNQQPQFQNQNQIPQSDPYSDFISEFSRCSLSVQNKILNDSEFKSIMEECDKRMQSMIEDIIRPQVMQTPEGRVSFEKMLATFRQVKDKYIKEENESMEVLQKVMQDEVVKRRIAELSGMQKAGAKQ